MRSERMQGHEWEAYVGLGLKENQPSYSVMEHGMAYGTRVLKANRTRTRPNIAGSRSSHSTQAEPRNGVTQMDCNVCRCFDDH